MSTPTSLTDLIDIAATRHNASYRRLADIAAAAGHHISHNTLNRLRRGTYAVRPADTSIRAIAYLAGVSDVVAFATAGLRPPAAEPYTSPAEAQRMTTRQRRAVDELLRAFITPHATHAAPLAPLLAAREDLAAALDADPRDDDRLARAARSALAAIDHSLADWSRQHTTDPGHEFVPKAG